MSDTERLAAYLVGELDAEERAAVEAALARDPALRARLDALRRTDDALTRLPAVEPRPGFSDRLRTAVQDEVQRLERVRAVDTTPARRRFALPGWLVPAAAAALVLIVGGVVVGNLVDSTGGDADTAAAPAGGEDAAEMSAEEENRPVVVALGRTYDEESLAGAADAAVLDRFSRDRLADEEALRIARDYAQDLGIAADSAAAAATESEPGVEEAPGPDTMAQDQGALTFDAAVEGDATPDDLAAVAACLPQLFAGAEDALIPAYAEIATYEGEDAIIYGLVTDDPDSGRFDRVELWVVARDDCFILHQRIVRGG